jgi:hypothetical protein
MSALVAAVDHASGQAFILADSLAYTPDRRVVGQASKVRTFPHAHAIMAGRGNALWINRLMVQFERCANFDEMSDHLKVALPKSIIGRISLVLSALVWVFMAWKLPRKHFNCAAINPIELWLVGYSDRLGRMAAVASHSGTMFQLAWDDFIIGPALPPEELQTVPRATAGQSGSFVATMLNVMQRQRAAAISRTTKEVIGGAAVLTTLTRQGIAQRVIFRWDDCPTDAPQRPYKKWSCLTTRAAS